jgi:primosomal protein N''
LRLRDDNQLKVEVVKRINNESEALNKIVNQRVYSTNPYLKEKLTSNRFLMQRGTHQQDIRRNEDNPKNEERKCLHQPTMESEQKCVILRREHDSVVKANLSQMEHKRT